MVLALGAAMPEPCSPDAFVREQINKLYPVKDDLEGFCIVYFKETHRDLLQFQTTRVGFLNLLLQKHTPDEIIARLKEEHPELQVSLPPQSTPPSAITPRSQQLREYLGYTRLERPALLTHIIQEKLQGPHVATLLQTDGGGGRTLAVQVAEEATVKYGMSALWMDTPALHPSDPAEWYRSITGGNVSVTNQRELKGWLDAQPNPDQLLIIWRGPQGPVKLLQEAAAALRSFLYTHRQAALLVVSGPRVLQLRRPELYQLQRLFSPSSFVDVPDLVLGEVAQLLRLNLLDEALAPLYFEHTGGHLTLLHSLICERLTDPAKVLKKVIYEICMSNVLDKHRDHPAAQSVLSRLLRGEKVASLADPCIRHNPDSYPESRLYFDGLLIADSEGATRFRCEGVRWLIQQQSEGEP
jgi:hypothetical protein